MPDDDDQGLLEELGSAAAAEIELETLMGWDGDTCLCEVCTCQRFRDDSPDGLCDECRRGDHSS